MLHWLHGVMFLLKLEQIAFSDQLAQLKLSMKMLKHLQQTFKHLQQTLVHS
jgi:hypothetical protein